MKTDPNRTVTAAAEAAAQEAPWPLTCIGSDGAQWHPVRVEDMAAMEPPADPIGLRLGRSLLAATARLAAGWYMGPAARTAARKVARGWSNRPLTRCCRFVVGTSRWGGRKTGPNPTDRGRPGSKHHILVDANGVPVSAILTGANRNDVTQLLPLVDAISPIRGVRGRPLQKPKIVYADRGYDSDRHRQRLRERGIKPAIAKRRTEHGSGFG